MNTDEITAETMQMIYSEFEHTGVKKLLFFLALAKDEISQKRWGKLYARGCYALAAHLLLMSKRTKESQNGELQGVITSEKAGDLSVNFAPPSTDSDEAYYLRTGYGMEFLRLRKSLPPAVMLI